MFRASEPHGGVLIDRFVPEEEAAQLRTAAAELPAITLDPRELADLELIAGGAASPLTGFLGLRDYQSVLSRLRLADGTPWPVPVTLAVTHAELAQVLRAGAAALRDARRRLRGVLTLADAFVRSVRDEAVALYGTDDPEHPGVRYLRSRPTGLLGGPVRVLPLPRAPRASAPVEVRSALRRHRWSGLAGLATADGQGCLEASGVGGGALLATSPVALRDAPGRDALLQAIVLKNHGAREVFLEHERGDWLEVASRLDGDDLGFTPVLLGKRTAPVHPGLHGAAAA